MLTSTPLRDPLIQALAGYPALIVPGLNNSDAEHWQSRWQARLPHSTRIELDDWATPNLDKWCSAIDRALARTHGPQVLIAHSFGTLACARMAQLLAEKIHGLFLVAPADPDKFAIADQLPKQPLGVKTHVIASSNDPWMRAEKAAHWAAQWGADFLVLKDVGHINSASNLAEWPLGVEQLQRLMDGI
ncbi:MAG TPA: alpha/beta hydrolase [Cellvibrionaceae bacterium]|nr:alpha/beta hydrolase [Cellvibrionaceae bacterium]HMW47112.1 alpha/beta hydrolase [Cellvibrionaceae bacterium]HMW70443.1 alpha/beta hydrolase [Cellvibrionaceae bacterium]HNG60608.1 alpha/beta hydrolase [Cellvibrionaceae bacterium]